MGMTNTAFMADLFEGTGEALPDAGPQSVTLQGPTDLPGFRAAARRLLAQQVAPECVSWYSHETAVQDLFANVTSAQASGHTANADTVSPAITVPAGFLSLCQSVILHSDPGRFGLLYRLLWRLVHEPALRHDAIDADWVQAQRLAQAVRRDLHKMKAFVRFRTVQDETFRANPTGGPLHVAWFEPEHHIVQAIAPFFARRFTQMRWAILTPERCLAWDGATLRVLPGAHKHDAPPADAGEQLWLTYYQNIFNPARLKLKAMQKEMPRRYWKNLPEAQFISELSAQAATRQANMLAQAPTVPRRRIPGVQRQVPHEKAPDLLLIQ